jgi:hypothetical protein
MEKSNFELEKVICVGHFLKYCPKCKPHDGPEHPNNRDCKKYTPVTARYFVAVNSEEN